MRFGILPTKKHVQFFREDLNGQNGIEGRCYALLTVVVNVVFGVILTVGICYLIALKGIV
jgi:hypothetical protein